MPAARASAGGIQWSRRDAAERWRSTTVAATQQAESYRNSTFSVNDIPIRDVKKVVRRETLVSTG
jgi:hypothetical protein